MKNTYKFQEIMAWVLVALLAIAAISYMTSCDMIAPVFTDSDYVNHQNTVIPPDTLPLVDTSCQSYIPVPGEKFVCFWNNKDVFIEPIQWEYSGEPIDDMQSFLDNYGETHLYISGINKGGTIKTNAPASQFQARLGCIDGAGGHHRFAFANNSLIPNGCMTFDQYFAELTSKPNVELLAFYNTQWTCDQYNQIADFLLADCKECDFIIYIKHTNGCITQDRLDEMVARGATIIT